MRPTYASSNRTEKPSNDASSSSWARTAGVQSAPLPTAPVVRTGQPQPQGQMPDLSATMPPRRIDGDMPVNLTVSMAFPPDQNAVASLLNAARSGKGAIDLLLISAPNVNVKDANRRTALHLATLEDDVTAVMHLLNCRAGCDTADSHGITPLMDAARRGCHALVETLVEAGAKIKQADDSGRSVLSHAAEGGNVDCINTLWQKADPAAVDKNGQTALHHAASHGKSNAALRLLAGNVDINARDNNGNTALLIAASQNHLELVEQLLKIPACKPMTRNGEGCNIYVEACSAINLPLLDLLLKYRVPIEHFECNILIAEAAQVGAGDVMLRLKAEGGVLPNVQKTLFAAIGAGHDSVVDVLLEKYEADPNAPNEQACTPLQHAVTLGKHGPAKSLLDKGARIVNPSHTQPLLCLAVQLGHVAMVDVLLQQKPVALNMVNSAMKTPLALAAETGRVDLVLRLCEAGFDVNFAPPTMPLPVELAALGGHTPVLEILHQKRATYPENLLKDAVARGQVAVVEQLLETDADAGKAGIGVMSGFTFSAMMDLVMHAGALANDKKTGLRHDAELCARPVEFVPVLTTMMDMDVTQLATWLHGQGIRSVL